MQFHCHTHIWDSRPCIPVWSSCNSIRSSSCGPCPRSRSCEPRCEPCPKTKKEKFVPILSPPDIPKKKYKKPKQRKRSSSPKLPAKNTSTPDRYTNLIRPPSPIDTTQRQDGRRDSSSMTDKPPDQPTKPKPKPKAKPLGKLKTRRGSKSSQTEASFPPLIVIPSQPSKTTAYSQAPAEAPVKTPASVQTKTPAPVQTKTQAPVQTKSPAPKSASVILSPQPSDVSGKKPSPTRTHEKRSPKSEAARSSSQVIHEKSLSCEKSLESGEKSPLLPPPLQSGRKKTADCSCGPIEPISLVCPGIGHGVGGGAGGVFGGTGVQLCLCTHCQRKRGHPDGSNMAATQRYGLCSGRCGRFRNTLRIRIPLPQTCADRAAVKLCAHCAANKRWEAEAAAAAALADVLKPAVSCRCGNNDCRNVKQPTIDLPSPNQSAMLKLMHASAACDCRLYNLENPET